jgi:PhnB protein
MHFRPYLTFDGSCAEAMAFYQSVFGGKLDLMRFKDVPDMPCPPEAADRVMHAHLDVDGHSLMASDTMPGQPFAGMTGFGVTLAFGTVAEARKVFDALATGGTVGMPLEKTFWVEIFGMVTDRYGTPWLINGGPMTGPN